MGGCMSQDWRQASQRDRPYTLPAPPKPDISSGPEKPSNMPQAGGHRFLYRSQSSPLPIAATSQPQEPPQPQPLVPTPSQPPPAARPPQLPSILGRATYPDKIMGRYTIDKLLGQGKDGITFRVVEAASGAVYACKSIAKAPLLRAGAGEAIRTELRIMYHLQGHPSVVSLHEALEDECCVYFIMEVCAGGDLVEHLVRAGNYTEAAAARCIRQVLTAVAYMHDMGVLHRDIKLENFLYAQDPVTGELGLRVIDFGMSTFFRPGQWFREVLGTCYYMAPELLAAQPAYNESADIWSVGVILYMLLSGRPPFEGVRDDDVLDRVASSPGPDIWEGPWAGISPAAKECVSLMMARDPAARPSARALLLHPWIAEGGAANDGRPLEPAVLSRMRRFAEANRLRKAALKVLGATRSQSSSSDELVGLQQLFSSLDTEQRGALQLSTLTHTLSSQLSSASSLASSFATLSPVSSSGAISGSPAQPQGSKQQAGHQHRHKHGHRHGHSRHHSMPDQRQLQQLEQRAREEAAAPPMAATGTSSSSSSSSSSEGRGGPTASRPPIGATPPPPPAAAAAIAAGQASSDAPEPATPAGTVRRGPFTHSSVTSTGAGSEASAAAAAGSGDRVQPPQQQQQQQQQQEQWQSHDQDNHQQQQCPHPHHHHHSPEAYSPATSFSAWCEPCTAAAQQQAAAALLPSASSPTTAAAGAGGGRGGSSTQQQQEGPGLAHLRHMQPVKQQALHELDEMLGFEESWQRGTGSSGHGALPGPGSSLAAPAAAPAATATAAAGSGRAIDTAALASTGIGGRRPSQPAAAAAGVAGADDDWCSCSSDDNISSASNSSGGGGSAYSCASHDSSSRRVEEAALLAALQGADLNGDGVIDWEEFLAAMSPDMLLQEDNLARVFQLFDTDHDGYLSADEIRDALLITLPAPHPATRGGSGSASASASGRDVPNHAGTGRVGGPSTLGPPAASADKDRCVQGGAPSGPSPGAATSSSSYWTPFSALAQQGWLPKATSSSTISGGSGGNTLHGSSSEGVHPGAATAVGVPPPPRNHQPPAATTGSTAGAAPMSDTGRLQGRASATPMSDMEAAVSADVAALMSAVDRDELGRISFTSFKRLVTASSSSLTRDQGARRGLVAPAAS